VPAASITRRGRGRVLMEGRSREQVFDLIREHLADELDVDPAAIGEHTRFREDLEADSLDLYTLVQELEDTYGVKMSDEQAAQILTVGQAVDFVMAHDGTPDAA
jgi:acyl carrier protein